MGREPSRHRHGLLDRHLDFPFLRPLQDALLVPSRLTYGLRSTRRTTALAPPARRTAGAPGPFHGGSLNRLAKLLDAVRQRVGYDVDLRGELKGNLLAAVENQLDEEGGPAFL